MTTKTIYGICEACSEAQGVVDWTGEVLGEDDEWESPDPSAGMISSGLPEYKLVEHQKFVKTAGVSVLCPGPCPGSWMSPWKIIGDES